MGFAFFFPKKIVQLVPLNVPQLPLPQPITENGIRVHSIQYEMNECVRFYMWYELCQSLQPQDGQRTKIDYTFSSWNFAFYAFRLRFLDLFIWIKMETLSRLWVTSTAGEQAIFV